MSKKLFFIIQELETGGAQRVCVNLANYFAERGNQVMIGVLFHKKETIYPLHPSIRVVDMPPLRFGRLVGAVLFHFELLFLRFRPDTIISFMWASNVFASIYARLFGAKVILSERSNPELAKIDSVLLRLGAKYFRYASKMVVLNQGAWGYMIREMGLPESRIIKIPNPCTIQNSSYAKRLLNESYLLAVGRLEMVKGFDRLIRMFAVIAARKPDEHLVFCGTGTEESRLTALAQELHLSDKIHFVGECRALAPWYQHADALVFTSHYEGWPNVIMEAMGHGLPVIVFDCQYGPSDIIIHHENGILIPQNDEDCFVSETLLYLESFPDSRARYSQKAILRMNAFSPENVFPHWETLVQEERKH